MNQDHFVYRGTKVAFRRSGNGEPILLLHGFGEDSRVFDGLLPAWAAHATLVVPDLPGSGQSAFSAELCSSIDLLGHCMRSLMNHLGFVQYGVLGHSMGGYIAMAMVDSFAEEITRLGLLHSTAFADSEAKKETRQKSIEVIAENGPVAFLQTAIPALFSPTFARDSTGQVNELIERGNDFSAEALMAFTRAMMTRPDRSTLLNQFPKPVLFIIGTEDKAVPMQDVLQQAHLPAHGVVHILRGVGHMGMLEAPKAFEEAVGSFLKMEN